MIGINTFAETFYMPITYNGMESLTYQVYRKKSDASSFSETFHRASYQSLFISKFVDFELTQFDWQKILCTK